MQEGLHREREVGRRDAEGLNEEAEKLSAGQYQHGESDGAERQHSRVSEVRELCGLTSEEGVGVHLRPYNTNASDPEYSSRDAPGPQPYGDGGDNRPICPAFDVLFQRDPSAPKITNK
jgi:hypothetical protein